MIQVSAHKYSLKPNFALNAASRDHLRKGALLKVTWNDELTGYADCFPWEEWGDEPLPDQLHALKQGRITPVMEQSLWLAKRDALARKEKRSGFAGLPKVKNHYLILDYTKITDDQLHAIKKAGFSTLKIKVGRDLGDEISWISRVITQFGFVMRLDYNATADFAMFERAMGLLKQSERARIEFVEDPFPFEMASWTEASKLVPLAIDQEQEKVDWPKEKTKLPFKVLVVKPARQDVEKASAQALLHDINMVVTSSMDHPVGVAHALWVAGEQKKKYPYRVLDSGCMSLSAYPANDFSSGIVFQGPYLLTGTGSGIGFDRLWKDLNWISIRQR